MCCYFSVTSKDTLGVRTRRTSISLTSPGREKRKEDKCIFRLMVRDGALLMVGVHMDDIIASGGKNAWEKFFAQLKERFPVKTKGN